MGGTIHRREDTATSFRTLTSIDVHSPATPSQVPVPRQMLAASQQRISSAGRISPSNSSPPEFPPPRPMPRHPWQRSASCRELYASSFEDSGKARSKDDRPSDDPILEPFRLPSQGELDNPVTRYDESNRSYSAASSKLPSLDHDSVPERVYSSSYPGTSSLSTESGHEESGPAGDLSHDDLSHDSYELLEREHEFEYPESYSSPRDDDDENEPMSDRSDEGIEHEMFQMDSETDSFVKHRSIKSTDRQQFKSVLADLKNARTKSIDRYSAVTAKPDSDYITVESRIQRSSTQIERKFETRHANSIEQQQQQQQQQQSKHSLPHQDSGRKDPVVLQVQKQKMSVLNELKNLKPKYKITHVDSEILRDEGIMRPKSRIDDDLSPVDSTNRTIIDQRARTVRARSIASLEDHISRAYVETGSLGRGYKGAGAGSVSSGGGGGDSGGRDRKSNRESETKLEKTLTKLQDKERRSVDREERKRVERDYSREYSSKKAERSELRERRSVERLDSRDRKSDMHGRRSVDRIDARELRRSIERLDVRERSYERLDSKEKSFRHGDPYALRGKSVERLDCQELRGSTEYLNRSPKEKTGHRYSESRERRERSVERLDSKEKRRSPGSRSNTVDYNQRHTLERFDSGNKSPLERLSAGREHRGKSVERLDSQEKPTFDFDPVTIERLKSLERCNNVSKDKGYDKKAERKSFEKLDSRERRHPDRLDSRERKQLDRFDSRAGGGGGGGGGRSFECIEQVYDWRRNSIERIEYKESRKSKGRTERGKSEEKPRERDDWRSLEKARKDEEKRERERQARLSIESRTDTVIGVPMEMENFKSKTMFTEYEPKIVGGVVLGFDDTIPGHTPVERTKSDPNPARQRLGSNSKRHILMHQKSIDLTPADSGDEDPFSDSAAMQKANIEIPYMLHKRHVMNGTASDEKSESDSGKTISKKAGAVRDLPKLPLKMITDISCFDLSKLSSIDKPSSKLSPDKPKSVSITPMRPKSILSSPSDKPKSILSPTSKLSPTDAKNVVCSFSPTNRSPSKAGSKAPSPDKQPFRSASFDKNRTEIVIEDRTGIKSSSLDKKTSKLSPIEPNVTILSSIEKRSPKMSPTDPNVTIVSVIQKRRTSPSESSKSFASAQRSLDSKVKPLNFADVVGMEMKMKLERKAKSEMEKDSLKTPDDSLEKQDSIEKIPLPEIPKPVATGIEDERFGSDKVEKVSPIDDSSRKTFEGEIVDVDGKQIKDEEQTEQLEPQSQEKKLEQVTDVQLEQKDKEKVKREEKESLPSATTVDVISEKPKVPEKPKTLEKPSIPEKTKRILEKIESKFSEARIAKPKIIDTGFDDFVEPVADLPLDEVPVKPALELDSLKVPEFVPFMSRPHGEPLRSKSLSLAEEKAPIDTLLSPEVENKHFVPDVSPKRAKRAKPEPKKDFKKQSKSLEGDKPPLKKATSKESRVTTPSSKIDKSKLKLGEMPQEIIIIDSTDVAPEVSIVQKGRSKSITRLPEKAYSASKEEKEESKGGTRAKSASVDDDLIKVTAASGVKSEKTRPKSLGISKSLSSSAERKDSAEKISPKRTIVERSKSGTKSETKSTELKSPTSMKEIVVSKLQQESRALRAKIDLKAETDIEESRADTDFDARERETMDASRAIEDRALEKKSSYPQDLTQSPVILRKLGQTPVLFARARLGLSEGSGIGALQRQGATQSPTSQRRAKSLDAPVIAVHKLPPATAFSSKDDTVDVSENPDEEKADEDVPTEAVVPYGSGAVSTTGPPMKPQSIQIEASPNHRSDSTDHTTIPEIFTDSLSVTETSAQYLESPLTESNEIIPSADLIPYERDVLRLDANGKDQKTMLESVKVDEKTKFIDQSSVESGTEQEVVAFDKAVRAEKIDLLSVSKTIEGSVPRPCDQTATEAVSLTKEKLYERSMIVDESTGKIAEAEISTTVSIEIEDEERRQAIKLAKDSKKATERDDLPDVTVTTVTVTREDTGPTAFLRSTTTIDFDDGQDMVKSPIQISIEECSDDDIGGDAEEDDAEEDEEEIAHSEDEREAQEQEGDENRPLDSADTSEDTLDALDTQVHMRGIDSELSSPDYGVDKMDEKTLVEVELTPEYLEMRREDEDGELAEELPKDEETVEEMMKELPEDVPSANRLTIDKKLRLSSERSRSEETSTWTPDREDPESSSCSIARPLGIGQIQPIVDRREIVAMMKDARGPGSLEEENSSGSQSGLRHDLNSTWKSFPLESSGSSSNDEGWTGQDENNAVQSQSEDSNGQNEDSFQEDLADFPGSFIYPIGPDILTSCGTFALTRTLSRISERSTTSEQDKSDLEDSFKPSSRSPSLDDESLISSDHQLSLSSDPPSGTPLPSISDDRRTSSELPDIPIDVVSEQEEEAKSPKSGGKPKLQEQSSEDWPSPPSSPVFDPPVVSHVETFYMEIKPEEAVKVTVTDSTETPGQVEHDSDSSDENRTLHDDLHSTFFEDGHSSTSATTVDGTVKIAVKPKSNSHVTGSSHSEDTSMGLSMSEWSSSNNTVRQFCQYSGTKSDDNSLAELGASISDWSGSTTVIPQQHYSSLTPVEKSQSDTTTSDKSVTSMRPNSKCRTADGPPLIGPSSPPLPPPPTTPPLTPSHSVSVSVSVSVSGNMDRRSPFDEHLAMGLPLDGERSSSIGRTIRNEQSNEAKRFIDNQFDDHRLVSRHGDDERQGSVRSTYISPPRITLQNEFDETIDDEFRLMSDDGDAPLPILEEEEELDDQEVASGRQQMGDDRLYDNVPAMKYSGGDQIRMEVGRGDNAEDMHEKYADLALGSRPADDDWSFEEEREETVIQKEKVRSRSTPKFERGFSEPMETGRYHETRSTERPVLVPIRAKSTPYYSTTSLSGESTTSSPPMQIRTQIRTKTMPYSSSKSPQSEGDTSSSMDSPVHTPVHGQIAVRRRRRENLKRRHRVVVDFEVKDGQIISSTDSSFDVATIPPPLLAERSRSDVDDDEDDDDDDNDDDNDGDDDDEYSEAKEMQENRRQQR